MKLYCFYFILFIVSISCSIQGITNDYGKLSIEHKKRIVELVDFNITNSEYIYKLSGLQLKEELKKHPRSLVYLFKNGCASKLCKPLMVYENYAKQNGYKLFLVMNGYANLSETLIQPYTSTLFSINNDC